MERGENKNIVHNFLTPAPPQWWLNAINLDFDMGVYRYALPASKPDYNLLVSLSWRIVKARGADKLIPSTDFSKYIASRVADDLDFGRWLEVVAAPRSGKSAGAIEGLVRWLIENNLKNYAVIVVAANRRLAENLYKYVIGAAIKVYKELKKNGVYITRGDLFERIRVRLYLGSEASCLLNKPTHFVEYCIKGCDLFRKYEKKWRNLPPVPALDPWVLKFSGYCPFVSANAKSYWYKSIVVVTADSLFFALKKVLSYKIKRVILVFDEYLVMLNRRGKVRRIDPRWIKEAFGDIAEKEFSVRLAEVEIGGGWQWVDQRVKLVDLIKMWNDALRIVNDIAVNRYTEKVKEASGPGLVNVFEEMLTGVIDMKNDVLYRRRRLEDGSEILEVASARVLDYIIQLYSIAAAVVDISKRVEGIERSMKLKRLGYVMMNNVAALLSGVGFIDLAEGKTLVDVVTQLRWMNDNGEELIVGWAGGFVRAAVVRLINNNVDVAVVTTSVDSADVWFYRVFPHEKLEHVRISLDVIVKRVDAYSISFSARGAVEARDDYEVLNSNTLRDMFNYLALLAGKPGNSVVVGSKRIIKIGEWILKSVGIKCDEVGDKARGVVDYVICEKPRGGQLMLVSPHSRVSMGIDPPLSDPDEVVLLYGLRRPAREYIKVRLSAGLRGRLVGELWDLRVVSFENNIYYVYWGDDARYSYVYVYDAFDSKYDVHMLIQVAGRWYMQKVRRVFYNSKYDMFGVKYFLIDYGILVNDYAPYYVFRGFRQVDALRLPVLEGYNDFGTAVRDVVRYERVENTVDRVLRSSYEKAYNAVKTLKRGSSAWERARAASTVLNAFLYIDKNGVVPARWLSKLYDVYARRGSGAVFDELEATGVKSNIMMLFKP